MEENERKWTGIWIPREWYLDKDLSWTEKLLILEIYYLSKKEGCYASNKRFADHLGVGEGHITNLLSKLKDRNIIEEVFFDGRCRVIKISENTRRRLEPTSDQTPEKDGVRPQKKMESDPRKRWSQTPEKDGVLNNNINSNINISNPKGLDDRDTSTSKKTYEEDSIEYTLAFHLIDQIEENFPHYKKKWPDQSSIREKTLQKWARQIDLMIRKDKHEPEEILDVINWCQNDNFWKKNILSAGKLRKQFFELLAKMENGTYKITSTYDANSELTQQILNAYKVCISNSDYKPTLVEHSKFVETSKRMIKFYSRLKNKVLQEHQIKYLFNCLQKKYADAGDTIYPGTLCSGHTWDILMPQYMKNTFGFQEEQK